MAAPSVTYTFSNSTTADATQVNQNFTDIINGLSDGTKDLTINAITCAGAATLNGNVTLGNGSPDDITISGSLASTIAIKTTFSYDLGSSTIGWKSFYLGSNDSAARTVRLIAGAVGSSYTFTLPTGAGSAGQSVMNLGSGSTAFLSQGSGDIINCALAASVGSSALTVSLKGADGSDPSATNPVYITFRNATSATGTPVTRAVTSALSVVVSSGSTLGHASAVTQYVYVYAIDNAGTVELAVSGQKVFEEGTIVSTTAEGGAGAADSGNVLYSTTARSNIACRLLGRLTSSQATAGTWATAISEISLLPFNSVIKHLGTEAWTDDQANTTTSVDLIRIGNRLFVDGTVTYTGAQSGAFNITIPAQYAAAYSTYNRYVGEANLLDTGTTTYLGTCALNTSTNLTIQVKNAGSTYVQFSALTNTIPHTWANGDFIYFQASWPVSGWN